MKPKTAEERVEILEESKSEWPWKLYVDGKFTRSYRRNDLVIAEGDLLRFMEFHNITVEMCCAAVWEVFDDGYDDDERDKAIAAIREKLGVKP